MNRRSTMLERLPPLYRIERGSLMHDFFAVLGNDQAAYDEDMQRVQRSHWVDTALDREELARIGALFDVEAMPWEPADLYRARLKATIAARLRGAVTRPVLEFVVTQILSGVLDSLSTKYMELSAATRFRDSEAGDPGEAAFVEFPKVLRRSPDLVARRGLLRSLDKALLVNRGIDPVPLQILIRGVAGGPCMVPVIVNLSSGDVMAYVGDVPCGHELLVTVDSKGKLHATLQGEDVLSRIYTGRGFTPGAQFSPLVPDATPEPLMLARGENRIWFFPLALYGEKSLGSAVFGMPLPDLVHGQYAGADTDANSELVATVFDNSLFEQTPAASLDCWWIERQPASFRIEVPAGVVLRDGDTGRDGHVERLRLFELLEGAIAGLRAAGVEGHVQARSLRETQRQRDLVRVPPTIVAQEQMNIEARLRALSAIFDTTATDGSRFA